MTLSEALSEALGSQNPNNPDQIVAFWRKSWAAMPLSGSNNPWHNDDRNKPVAKAYKRKWLFALPFGALSAQPEFAVVQELAEAFVDKGRADISFRSADEHDDWKYKTLNRSEIELR